jgi:hypothetical protein
MHSARLFPEGDTSPARASCRGAESAGTFVGTADLTARVKALAFNIVRAPIQLRLGTPDPPYQPVSGELVTLTECYENRHSVTSLVLTQALEL